MKIVKNRKNDDLYIYKQENLIFRGKVMGKIMSAFPEKIMEKKLSHIFMRVKFIKIF